MYICSLQKENQNQNQNQVNDENFIWIWEIISAIYLRKLKIINNTLTVTISHNERWC